MIKIDLATANRIWLGMLIGFGVLCGGVGLFLILEANK